MFIITNKIYIKLILVYFYCISSTVGLELNADHEEEHSIVKYFEVGEKLELSCSTDRWANIKWKKNGTDVNIAFGQDTQHINVVIDRMRSTFLILHARTTDDGEYTCEAGGEKQRFHAVTRPMVRVKPRVATLLEGETLTLLCLVIGTRDHVNWIAPTNVTADRIQIESVNYLENGTMIIENVQMTDEGEYTCQAELMGETFTDTALVQVIKKAPEHWSYFLDKYYRKLVKSLKRKNKLFFLYLNER